MALKYGPFSEVKTYTLVTNQTSITIASSESYIPHAVGASDVFDASGAFTASGGMQLLQYRFDGGSWFNVQGVATGSSGGNWVVAHNLAALPDGYHEFEIKVTDALGGTAVAKANFWYKVINIYFYNGIKHSEVVDPQYWQGGRGIFVTLKNEAWKWDELIAAGVQIFACNDFDPVTFDGTWENITGSVNKNSVYFKDLNKKDSHIGIRVAIPLPPTTSVVLDGFSYNIF